MLKVYDILIGKDKPVVDVFFLNINDFLTGFCVQLDENSKQVLSAEGSGYTTIQTQTVNANLNGYTGRFNMSGPDSRSNVSNRIFIGIRNKLCIFQITFSSDFTNSYSSWHCASSANSTCRYVCLATAWINQTAMVVNTYLADALFSDQLELSINKSVSDLHQVSCGSQVF